MNVFKNTMGLLMSAVEGMRRPANYEGTNVSKARVSSGGSAMTRKGAIHKVNPTFLSIPGIHTPAEFRRLHLGSTKRRRR